MAKGKVSLKSLRSGQTVYRVSGRAGGAYISTLHITSRPYQYKKKNSALHGSIWVNFIQYYKSSFNGGKDVRRADNFSLSDAGIHKPHYGSVHRTFYNLKAAERWKEYVDSLPPEDDLWDIMDYCDWDHSDHE